MLRSGTSKLQDSSDNDMRIHTGKSIPLGLQTEGELESSENPRSDGHGAGGCGAGGDGRGDAGSSQGRTSHSCLTTISRRSSGLIFGTFGCLLKVSNTLNLLELMLLVSILELMLDFKLSMEPSDSLALRSRLCPMVSVSRGFFAKALNIIGTRLQKIE